MTVNEKIRRFAHAYGQADGKTHGIEDTPRRRVTVRMEDLKTKPSPLAVLREQNKQLLAERNQHAENARWYKSQLDAQADGLGRAEDTYCELIDKKRECKSLYVELAIREHQIKLQREERSRLGSDYTRLRYRFTRVQRDLKDANTSLKVYRVSIALTGVAVCAAAILHVIGV